MDVVTVLYPRPLGLRGSKGGSVGLAMIEPGVPVDAAYLSSGTWEVEINGKLYPCVASLRPMYDPEMKRIKT